MDLFSSKKLDKTIINHKSVDNHYQLEYKCSRCNELHYVNVNSIKLSSDYSVFLNHIKKTYDIPQILECSNCRKYTMQSLVSFTQNTVKEKYDIDNNIFDSIFAGANEKEKQIIADANKAAAEEILNDDYFASSKHKSNSTIVSDVLFSSNKKK